MYLCMQAGFAVWAVDGRHSQLELSACAGCDPTLCSTITLRLLQ